MRKNPNLKSWVWWESSTMPLSKLMEPKTRNFMKINNPLMFILLQLIIRANLFTSIESAQRDWNNCRNEWWPGSCLTAHHKSSLKYVKPGQARLVVSVSAVIKFLESAQSQVWELYGRGLFCFKTFSIVFQNRRRLERPSSYWHEILILTRSVLIVLVGLLYLLLLECKQIFSQ